MSDAYAALEADPRKPMLNRAISERYAPGSTFKVLTAIALIENGIANPDTRMDSPVSTTLPGDEHRGLQHRILDLRRRQTDAHRGLCTLVQHDLCACLRKAHHPAAHRRDEALGFGHEQESR